MFTRMKDMAFQVLVVFLVLSVHISFVTSNDNGRVHMFNDKDYGEYWWYRGDVTWTEARKQCQNEGGDLATIKDAYLQDTLTKVFSDKELNAEYGTALWLGAHQGTETGWTWLGQHQTTSLDVGLKYAPCAYMEFSGDGVKFMANKRCEERKKYICGRQDCHGGSKCYHASQEEQTWQAARLDCQHKDLDLVTFSLQNVTKEVQAKYLQNLNQVLEKNKVDFGNYWVGLIDKYWKWVDGEDVVYGSLRWDPKSPASGKGDCMAMWKSGHWIRNNCNEKLKSFLCQILTNQNKGSDRVLVSVLVPIILVLIVVVVIVIIYIRRKRMSGEPSDENKDSTNISFRPFKPSQSFEKAEPSSPGLYASIDLYKPPDNTTQPGGSNKTHCKSNPNPYSRPPSSPPPAVPRLAAGYSEPMKGTRAPSVAEAEYSVPYERPPPKPPRQQQVEPQDTVFVENDLYCTT